MSSVAYALTKTFEPAVAGQNHLNPVFTTQLEDERGARITVVTHRLKSREATITVPLDEGRYEYVTDAQGALKSVNFVFNGGEGRIPSGIDDSHRDYAGRAVEWAIEAQKDILNQNWSLEDGRVYRGTIGAPRQEAVHALAV